MKIKTFGIVGLSLILVVSAFGADADTFQVEEGFVPLFNGRDLTGWGYAGSPFQSFDGKAASSDARFEVNDGAIRANERTPRLIQQLATQRPFPSDFVLRLEFRAATNADSGIFIRGIQIQCRDYNVAGPYYNLTLYRPQEWNAVEITVKGNVAYGVCNGQVLEPALIVPATGSVALEGDRGVMEFRRIRIKELASRTSSVPITASSVVAPRAPRIDPAAFNRPIRVAVIGDNLTQPATILDAEVAARGGIQIAGASERQQAAVKAVVASNARASQAATAVRMALLVASFATPAEIEAKIAELAKVELSSAFAQADAFNWLQASSNRLDASMAAAFVQQAVAAGGRGGGARGGRGGGPAPAAVGVLVPPTDYPSQLGQLLGTRWDIRNFGVNGTTVLKRGDAPYWAQPAFFAAREFNPDAVVIMFGLNDSRPENWRYTDAFVADYKVLISMFASLPARPAIWIAKPPPAFSAAGGVDGNLIGGEIATRLETIAREAGVGIIDLYTPLKSSMGVMLDGVHPDSIGANALATRVQAVLTSQRDGP